MPAPMAVIAGARSSRVTVAPARASRTAVARPPMPAPTTATCCPSTLMAQGSRGRRARPTGLTLDPSSHEERRDLASLGECGHLPVGRSLLEPLGRVEEPGEDLDV